MTTASRSTIVQTVSRCIVARSWAIGTASTVSAAPAGEQPLGERLDARPGSCAGRRRSRARRARAAARRRPRATPGPPGCRRRAARCRRSAGGGGRSRRSSCSRAGGPASRAGHRDPWSSQTRGVAGEQQVGQRADDEVCGSIMRSTSPPGCTGSSSCAMPGHQHRARGPRTAAGARCSRSAGTSAEPIGRAAARRRAAASRASATSSASVSSSCR